MTTQQTLLPTKSIEIDSTKKSYTIQEYMEYLIFWAKKTN